MRLQTQEIEDKLDAPPEDVEDEHNLPTGADEDKDKSPPTEDEGSRKARGRRVQDNDDPGVLVSWKHADEEHEDDPPSTGAPKRASLIWLRTSIDDRMLCIFRLFVLASLASVLALMVALARSGKVDLYGFV